MPLKIIIYCRHHAIALLALVCSLLALAGASYAALSLPRNSVGSRQLRNGAVTAHKLAKHAVGARSLDPQSIAAHVVAWAGVSAIGHVGVSGPSRAVIVRPDLVQQGSFRISWNRPLSARCSVMATPYGSVASGEVGLQAIGPVGVGAGSFVVVQTFNQAGIGTPESFTVMVLCP